MLSLYIPRFSWISWARTSLDTRIIGVLFERIITIKPKHISGMVIPKTHDQNHSSFHCLSHRFHTSFVSKTLWLSKNSLLISTMFIGDGVISSKSWNICLRESYFFTILNIKSFNALKFSSISVINSDELSNNFKWFCGIDLEIWSWSIEVLISISERIQITTIFIANSILSMWSISAFLTLASMITWNCAWMSCISISPLISFPYIKFSTASSIFSLIIFPILGVCLSPNKLHVMRTLSITITSSIFGPCLISWPFWRTSIRFHLNKVKCSIDSALKLRDINVKTELFI